jgi:hypothetical protein
MFGRRDKGSGETCAACATTEDFAREGAAIASAAHDLLECHPISGRRNFINIGSEPSSTLIDTAFGVRPRKDAKRLTCRR